jgi:hypothetical protein
MPADRGDPIAQRHRRQSILIGHEIIKLAHRIIALGRRHRVERLDIGFLIGNAGEERHLAVDQIVDCSLGVDKLLFVQKAFD